MCWIVAYTHGISLVPIMLFLNISTCCLTNVNNLSVHLFKAFFLIYRFFHSSSIVQDISDDRSTVTMNESGISKHMQSQLRYVLPRIPDTTSAAIVGSIDLKSPHNRVIHPELLKICQETMAQNLTTRVSLCRHISRCILD